MIFVLVLLTFLLSISINYLLSRRLIKESSKGIREEEVSQKPIKKSGQLAGLLFLDDLLYSLGHTWVDLKSSTVSVGSDDFASKFVGKIERIETLPVGVEVKRGQPLWRIFFGDRWLVQRSPISGKVAVINQKILKNPHLLGEFPYGDKWIVKIIPESIIVESKKLLNKEKFMQIVDKAISKFLSQLKPSLGELYTDSGALIKGAACQLRDDQWEEISTELFNTDLGGE